ncbi:MAG: preprotein translocase subunit SecG [Clostridia bacterium]|nr:preprotein translocase subunit SecG [Clostridia bacterium]MBQ2692078.1 preprotein translocase subunit SecG [Clostridia bacterium]MBQ3062283.1 preprotein translocase subunit SecG [Clostridia bacterium]MBQ5813669.1 preprotein translocase subunit SecG [Clostridia bacterium]MBQ9966727.1 preprotein translocase subunit SecG [Clostridia bacterium]
MGETLRLVITVVHVVVCIALIGSVLMQSGKGRMGESAGAAETFFGKNMARSMDAKLEKVTQYSAGAFLLLTAVLAIF